MAGNFGSVDLELTVWLGDIQYGLLSYCTNSIISDLTLWQYKAVPQDTTQKVNFIKLALIKAKIEAFENNKMIVVTFNTSDVTEQFLINVVNDHFGGEYIVNNTFEVLKNLVGEEELKDGRTIAYNSLVLVV
jgi:hypothetical protein